MSQSIVRFAAIGDYGSESLQSFLVSGLIKKQK